MKRGAEKQLSKDSDMDFEHEDDSEPSQGFRKADESVLVGRTIRALPKRASSASLGSAPPLSDPSTSEIPPVPLVPKLTSFGGFGSGSNSFTFGASTASSSLPSFGTPTSGGTASNPKPAAPTVSASASGATKAFASFLAPTSSPPAAAASVSSDKKDEIDPAALKYYKSLRGLNVSFLSAISKAVEQDSFTDVSDMVSHYKNFRVSVQKEFDERPKPAQSKSVDGPSSSSSSAPASEPMSTMSAGFTGFGKVSTPPSTAPTSGGGFSPKIDVTASSAFTLPTSSAASVAPSNPPKSAFGSTANVPDFLSAPKTSTDSGPKSTSPFGSSPFGTSAPSSFGNFGSSSSKPSESNNDKETFPNTESTSSATTNLFGTASANPFSIPDKPPMTSSFGKPPPAFAGFGSAKSGAFSNPVGFGFGNSPPKTPDGEPSAAPQTTSLFGGSSFSGFGASPAKPAAEESGGSQEEEADGTGDGAADDSKSLPTKSHDEEGEGEEDEETTHTTKSKVYKLVKDDSSEGGKPGWKDMGVGMLRLKKHKVSGSRRVLLRNSSTGKITINFNIYSGLNPSLGPKTVTFVGHDESGISVTYRLRTPTEQHATELKDAMSREIAFVKGDSE